MRAALVAGAIALVGAPAVARAEAPARLNFAGTLDDVEGQAVDGDYEITFRIANAATGGTFVWQETQTVEVAGGSFSAGLGSVNAIDESIFQDQSALWLELVVDGDTLSPRLPIASVPWAMFANSTANVECDGCIGSDQIDPGAVQGRIAGTCEGGGAITAINPDGTVTCSTPGGGGTITGVTAGAGLTGGGTTGAVGVDVGAGFGVSIGADSIGVDPTLVQRRVASCASGSAVRTVNEDGTVLCEVAGGDITGVSVGTGISGGGTSGAVSVSLDTGYTDGRYLNVTGDTMAGTLNMGGFQITNQGCRSGYELRGAMCIRSSDVSGYSYSGGENFCRGEGAHLCTAMEIRRAMMWSTSIGGGFISDYMADQIGDDTGLYVNNAADANNPDGADGDITDTDRYTRCCYEVF
jgi:hypothetical protein